MSLLVLIRQVSSLVVHEGAGLMASGGAVVFVVGRRLTPQDGKLIVWELGDFSVRHVFSAHSQVSVLVVFCIHSLRSL